MIGALRGVGRDPSPEFRIRQQDNVFAVLVTGHLLEERGDSFVEGLQQTLLGLPFVCVRVEPAQLHRVHPGGHCCLDRVRHHAQLAGQRVVFPAGRLDRAEGRVGGTGGPIGVTDRRHRGRVVGVVRTKRVHYLRESVR